MVLRHGRDRPRLQALQGLEQGVGHLGGEPVVELTGRLPGRYGRRALYEDRPMVHLLVHEDDGHTRLALPIDDGPLYGGSTPVLRQERGVAVDAPLGRDGQHIGGQDFAVGRNHNHLRLQGAKLGDDLRTPQGRRLQAGDSVVEGELLNGRSAEPASPAGVLIGLGNHRPQSVP